MNRFSISEEAINKVLAYLATRPYHEVFAIIAGIHGDVQKIEEVIAEAVAVVKKRAGENAAA